MTELVEPWQAPATAEATEADRAAVRAAVLDYFEGWFDADAVRMDRALHPELAKRSFAQDPDRTPALSTLTAAKMIESTSAGSGRARRGSGSIDVRIDDISGGIASVTVRSDAYVEYLHLVATPDGWKIVNALWRFADGHGPRA